MAIVHQWQMPRARQISVLDFGDCPGAHANLDNLRMRFNSQVETFDHAQRPFFSSGNSRP